MSCETCALVTRRDKGEAPVWDTIHRTAYFDVAHAYNTSLPGWLVIVARTHVPSIAELSPGAAAELGVLIHQASIALTSVTGCEKTYVMQFAEAPGHGHVHFHVVPRMADIPDDDKGPKVFNYLGVADEARLDDKQMDEIALALRPFFQSEASS